MAHAHPHPTVVIGGHPFHTMLGQFPVVCFTLTLFTDVTYWRTSNLIWQYFSAWLLLAGLVFGALAVIVALIEFLVRPVRARGPAWIYAIGSAIVLALAIVNSFVHAADGWTSVVPWGLTLSAVTVVLMIVTGWFGRGLVFGRDIGGHDHV